MNSTASEPISQRTKLILAAQEAGVWNVVAPEKYRKPMEETRDTFVSLIKTAQEGRDVRFNLSGINLNSLSTYLRNKDAAYPLLRTIKNAWNFHNKKIRINVLSSELEEVEARIAAINHFQAIHPFYLARWYMEQAEYYMNPLSAYAYGEIPAWGDNATTRVMGKDERFQFNCPNNIWISVDLLREVLRPFKRDLLSFCGEEGTKTIISGLGVYRSKLTGVPIVTYKALTSVVQIELK